MSQSSAVVRFPEPVPAKKVPAPKWKSIKVGRVTYRVVQGKDALTFRWLQECGKNALGEPDWREVARPELNEVIAALYAAS